VPSSFDPTLKALVETSPGDWLTLLGLPRASVTVLGADVATVVAGAADKLLHVTRSRLSSCIWNSRPGTTRLTCPSGSGCIIRRCT
jgi:hypothetical protein